MTRKAAPAGLAAWEKAAPVLAEAGPDLLDRAVADAGDALCPHRGNVFRALELTPPDAVRVVILGQDPYHGPGQAHGLAFSVPLGVPAPPSLRNIFKEIDRDIGRDTGANGSEPPATDLTRWACQGVLLLNAVLTTELGLAGAHRGLGWHDLTDDVIRSVSAGPEPVAFMLWGGDARAKKALIDASRHLVLEAAHPSPLSAWRGFLGCGHFSAANAWLTDRGLRPVDW